MVCVAPIAFEVDGTSTPGREGQLGWRGSSNRIRGRWDACAGRDGHSSDGARARMPGSI